jgi:hypothetical protein
MHISCTLHVYFSYIYTYYYLPTSYTYYYGQREADACHVWTRMSHIQTPCDTRLHGPPIGSEAN